MFRGLIALISMMSFNAFAASANDLPEGWTLQCNINRSESLYIYATAEKKQVWYSYFLKGVEPLEVEKFDVFRCPGCFSVKAKHGKKTYNLSTRGQFNEGKFDVVGTLSVGKAKATTIACFNNDRK
jgi:hypothetical protein